MSFALIFTRPSQRESRQRDAMPEVFPLCFRSLSDYERWRKSFGASCSHCRDCLPGFQLRMKKVQRCEHPEVMFTMDEESGVVGA